MTGNVLAATLILAATLAASAATWVTLRAVYAYLERRQDNRR